MTTQQIKLSKAFCLSGVIGAIFYLLHDIVGSMYYPGYNWMSQAVSDLTATDAPSRIVAGGFSNVYGIMSCICCLFVCVLNTDKHKIQKIGLALFTTMEMISAIGYSIFPLSSSGYDGSVQSFMHVYVVTTAVVLLSIVSLIMIAVGSFKSKRKVLGVLAIIALVMMFVGAVGSNAAPKEIFGVLERFSTYSAVIFTGILGVSTFLEKA
ncbi:MAG: DUF998 domain-containing protein [Saccharofermentans sp.]|nr:DUF998 domain-containing protein [Saccharofermentans sp.]